MGQKIKNPGQSRQTITVEQFLDRLDGVREQGGGWIARCPNHDDDNPSLSIARGDTHPVVLHCFGGCDPDAVLGALNLTLADICGDSTGSNGHTSNGHTPPPAKEEQAVDWQDRHARMLAGPDREAHLAELAADLGPAVSIDVLRLQGVGWRKALPKYKLPARWSWPERDDAGNVVGLLWRCRKADTPEGEASKQRDKGSRSGLTYCDGWQDIHGPVLLPEGPTCAAALITAGLCAIGRPSNSCGRLAIGWLAALLKDVPADRPLIVVAERDKGAGLEGGAKDRQALARLLARPVRLALPPGEAKDSRDWLNGEHAAGRADALGERFLAGLVDVSECGSAEADALGPVSLDNNVQLRPGRPKQTGGGTLKLNVSVYRGGKRVDEIPLSSTDAARKSAARRLAHYLPKGMSAEALVTRFLVAGRDELERGSKAPDDTVAGLLAAEVPKRLGIVFRTPKGLWSEVRGVELDRQAMTTFCPPDLIDQAAKRGDAMPTRQDLIRQVWLEMGVLWSLLMDVQPEEIGCTSIGRDSRRGQQFRAAVEALWTKTQTFEVSTSTAGQNMAARSSLAHRAASAAAHGGDGGQWVAAQSSFSGYWTVHVDGDGVQHTLLGMMARLSMQVVNAPLPGVLNDADLMALGTRYGAIDATPPVVARLTDGRVLAVLSSDLALAILATADNDAKTISDA